MAERQGPMHVGGGQRELNTYGVGIGMRAVERSQ